MGLTADERNQHRKTLAKADRPMTAMPILKIMLNLFHDLCETFPLSCAQYVRHGLVETEPDGNNFVCKPGGVYVWQGPHPATPSQQKKKTATAAATLRSARIERKQVRVVVQACVHTMHRHTNGCVCMYVRED
eukprot:scpid60344/ scgid19986/ 